MVVVGIADAAVVVAVASRCVIVGAAKYVVVVEVETDSMVSPLIRRMPRAEVVVCSAGRPGAAVGAAINGRVAVARGATAPMTLFLRSREARADLVGIVCPEMTPVGNVASV